MCGGEVLRVCYLLPRLHLGGAGVVVGGCATNCTAVALELKRQGVQMELLAPVSSEAMASLSAHPLAEIVRPLPEIGTRLMSKGISAIRVLRRALAGLVREKRVDVIHSHSGTYPYAIVPLAADPRTCVRLHSLYCPIGARGGVYSRWWERPALARALFRRLDGVVAVTSNVRQSLEKAGVAPGKIESIPMCVDTRRFRPRQPGGPFRYFTANGDSVRLLYVGNASKEKGLAELLRAVKMLIDQRIRVFLVAAIENQSRVREYSAGHRLAEQLIKELAIERHVRLLGLVDGIEDLYAESDFLVIPWETSRGPSDYPMVALEAMAMGKCVIATPVGGCSELLDEGRAGILTEDFSAGSLVTAIKSALDRPESCRMVERAAVRRAEELSLTASAARMISFYEHLLEAKGRRD